jgi:hypothetical protein
MPTIGFLSALTENDFRHLLDAFLDQLRRGLGTTKWTVVGAGPTVPGLGANDIFVVSRWTNGVYGQPLRAAAGDLVGTTPTPIVIAATGGITPSKAVQALTRDIPILFLSGRTKTQEHDNHHANTRPIWLDNTLFAVEEVGRHKTLRNVLQLRDEAIFNLVHALSTTFDDEKDWTNAVVVDDGPRTGFGSAFQKLLGLGSQASALTISADAFFTTRIPEIVNFANSRFMKPVSYPFREYVKRGGLMSVGPNLTEAYGALGSWAAAVVGNGFTKDDLHKLPNAVLGRSLLVVNTATATSQLSVTMAQKLLQAADEQI